MSGIHEKGACLYFSSKTLTANDKESDMLKGYEAGGTDYITKPFSAAVLCKKIAAVFETIEQHHPTMICKRMVTDCIISGLPREPDCLS